MSLEMKRRAGATEVTSITLTKEFKKLVEQYNISPTEATRRGIAVILNDMGVYPYANELNKERSKLSKDIYDSVVNEEFLNDLEEAQELLLSLKGKISKLSKNRNI